jgi:hypothetical protein
LDEPENSKKIDRMKADLRIGSYKKIDNHRLRRAPARLPSASSAAGRLLLLFAMEFLGGAGTGNRELGLAKA